VFYSLKLFSEHKLLESFDDKKPVFVFFGAKWCGYCKKFKPEWEKLKKRSDIPVNFVYLEHTDKNNLKIFKNHNVKGFPTLKLCSNGLSDTKSCIVYKSKRDATSVVSFLKQNLKQ